MVRTPRRKRRWAATTSSIAKIPRKPSIGRDAWRKRHAERWWNFVRCERLRPGWTIAFRTPRPLLLRMADARATAEAVFREDAGRIIATLIRLSGSFDLAEEAMQEAFASALATWPESGVP